MSLAEYVDIDELMKNSVITLKYRHPVCSVCGRQRPQSEWKFIISAHWRPRHSGRGCLPGYTR